MALKLNTNEINNRKNRVSTCEYFRPVPEKKPVEKKAKQVVTKDDIWFDGDDVIITTLKKQAESSSLRKIKETQSIDNKDLLLKINAKPGSVE